MHTRERRNEYPQYLPAPTGFGSTWNPSQWETYYEVRHLVGEDLLGQIGQSSAGADIYTMVGAGVTWPLSLSFWVADIEAGPDRTTVVYVWGLLHIVGSRAATVGNIIYIDVAERRNRDALRALMQHEYGHVLHIREEGIGYYPDYFREGVTPSHPVYEAPFYDVEAIYLANIDWLPDLWTFPPPLPAYQARSRYAPGGRGRGVAHGY